MGYYETSLKRRIDIEDELLAMMKEVPYADISVKSLADRMNIVRKTFYRYFPNKQACLESLTDRLIYECNLQIMQVLPNDHSLEGYFREQMKFWMAHKDFLIAISRNQLNYYLVERYLEFCRVEAPSIKSHLNTNSYPPDQDVLLFYICGEISLLLKWAREDFPLSLDEMAHKKMLIVSQPLLQHI